MRDYCKQIRSQGKDVIVAGEFSFPPEKIDYSIDIEPGCYEDDQLWFQSMILDGFEDCYRRAHPEEISFSKTLLYTIRNRQWEVYQRSSIILATKELNDKYLNDCFYLNFSKLVVPLPGKMKKSSTKGHLDQSENEDESEEEKVSDKPVAQDAEETRRTKVIHPNDFPVVLDTKIPRMSTDAHFLPPQLQPIT